MQTLGQVAVTVERISLRVQIMVNTKDNHSSEATLTRYPTEVLPATLAVVDPKEVNNNKIKGTTIITAKEDQTT